MKIRVGEDRELILSEVFNGVEIETDAGLFGICQRDGGIEIRLGDGHWYRWVGDSGPEVMDPGPPTPNSNCMVITVQNYDTSSRWVEGERVWLQDGLWVNREGKESNSVSAYGARVRLAPTAAQPDLIIEWDEAALEKQLTMRNG